MTVEQLPDFPRRKQVCEVFGISLSTYDRMVSELGISEPSFWLKREKRVPKTLLIKLLRDRKQHQERI